MQNIDRALLYRLNNDDTLQYIPLSSDNPVAADVHITAYKERMLWWQIIALETGEIIACQTVKHHKQKEIQKLATVLTNIKRRHVQALANVILQVQEKKALEDHFSLL